ncbi:MAG: exo-alpha-sialidase [Paenibacillaceae bacterium]|nr:exo-alpha-sialidase [Paenibacillaceae bacterium]
MGATKGIPTMTRDEVTIITIGKYNEEFPRCSEGSIVELQDGRLLLSYIKFHKSSHGSNDTAPSSIFSTVSDDGGYTWKDEKVFVQLEQGTVNTFSPNYLRLPSGEILFLYFRYLQLEQGLPVFSRGLIKRSVDDGKTFVDDREMWDREPLGFPSSVIKRLSTGRLLLTVERIQGNLWTETDHSLTGVVWSDDDGHTWNLPEHYIDLPMRGAAEGHLEELADGRVFMIMRTQLGAIFKSYSSDGGITWSKPQTTGLRAPESCPNLMRIPQTGDLMIVWNNSEYDPNFATHKGKRSPLSVAVSKDEGETWHHIKDIESHPRWCYTNPGIAFTGEGKCILTYCAAEYLSTFRMGNPFDLRAAIFDIGFLYK